MKVLAFTPLYLPVAGGIEMIVADLSAALKGRGIETALVHAALSADRVTATTAWESWTAAVILEEAPHAELRLLPTVYANLSKVAPNLPLPLKLRGKARATFTFNRLITHESLPALRALTQSVPVIVAKGAALCERFNAWSFRQIGDVDIHVRQRDLPEAVDLLVTDGWMPKYGMTALSFKYRTPLRRNSWNLTREHGDIDQHWRLLECADAQALARGFWESASPGTLSGVAVRLPSPEFSVIGALQHGFIEGTRADALQALVDCWYWLSLCDQTKLTEAMALSEAGDLTRSLAAAYDEAGLHRDEQVLRPVKAKPSSRSPATGVKVRRDTVVVRNRRWYQVWERLGRRPRLERLILRTLGPFSKPLSPSTGPRSEYDLRDCAVIDEIGGAGWGWPEPEHTCGWSDQDDNRLLVRLPEMRDSLAILRVSASARHSPRPQVAIFVNGRPAGELDFTTARRSTFAILVPRAYLFGPWIELSFRPIGFDAPAFSTYAERRSLPAVTLQIIAADKAATVLAVRDPTPVQQRLDRGGEPVLQQVHARRGEDQGVAIQERSSAAGRFRSGVLHCSLRRPADRRGRSILALPHLRRGRRTSMVLIG